jgi:hypothetical protein
MIGGSRHGLPFLSTGESMNNSAINAARSAKTSASAAQRSATTTYETQMARALNSIAESLEALGQLQQSK